MVMMMADKDDDAAAADDDNYDDDDDNKKHTRVCKYKKRLHRQSHCFHYTCFTTSKTTTYCRPHKPH